MHLLKRTYIFLLSLSLTLVACKDNNTGPNPSQQPVVDFGWAGHQAAPATIIFNNNTQNATIYNWNFGNGTASTEQFPPAITYTQPGSYDIVLTATRGDKTVSLKRTIVIAPNDDPVALFTYTFKSPEPIAPATVDFVNESVNADTYEWTINGVSYITANPSNIVFNYAGDYSVRLVAIKGDRISPVYETTITILANTDPLARFQLAYHPYPYTAGEEIQLVNRSLNSDAWTWTFGTNGPAPITAQHPLVKFATPGTYPITLIAKKGAKSSAAFTINLKIN
jgi:PKD repeat protein